MSVLQEQDLFKLLAEVKGKNLPSELLYYIEHNWANNKALARLTSYLYLNMDDEFNQCLLNIIPDQGLNLGINFELAINGIIYNLADDIRSYEKGDKPYDREMKKLLNMSKEELETELNRYSDTVDIVMNKYLKYIEKKVREESISISNGIEKILELIEIKVKILKISPDLNTKIIVFDEFIKMFDKIIPN